MLLASQGFAAEKLRIKALSLRLDSLEGALIREGDWSPQAATHLLKLSKLYGSFMLRNALAISLVLEVEDGELAF